MPKNITSIPKRGIHTEHDYAGCWNQITKQADKIKKGSIEYREIADLFIAVSYEDKIWFNISIDPPDVEHPGAYITIIAQATENFEIDRPTKARIFNKMDELAKLFRQ